MYAYKTSFQWLPREQWKSVKLPSDLMNTPFVPLEGKTSVCHSESEHKWYILREVEPRTGEEIYSAIVNSGTFLDCYHDMVNPYWLNVPFTWGKQYHSKYSDILIYVPIYEIVPTGKYHTTDDGFEFAETKEVYKLITMYLTPCLEDDNVFQSNHNSRFEITDYDEDLYQLINDLQIRTGEIF